MMTMKYGIVVNYQRESERIVLVYGLALLDCCLRTSWQVLFESYHVVTERVHHANDPKLSETV
jgi:hypothetical protein